MSSTKRIGMMEQSSNSVENIVTTMLLNENSSTPRSLISSRPEMHFSLLDYVLFVGMLLLSTIIGIYYGFLARTKQNTVKEYLLGGKTMHIIPISVSLIAS